MSCKIKKLSLPLFKLGIFLANYIQAPFTPYYLAVGAALFNGCSYFHFLIMFLICT